MPGSGEQYGGTERNLSLFRQEFVDSALPQILGRELSGQEKADYVGALVMYEQKLINEGIIELHD